MKWRRGNGLSREPHPAVVFNAILSKAPTAPVRLNPDLPGELERIINKALEKDRKLRYQSASDMRADLKRLKRDSSRARSTVTPSEATAAKPPLLSRRRALYAALALVLVAIAGTALYLYLGAARESIRLPSCHLSM